MNTDTPFLRTTSNFWNVDPQPILVVKTFIDVIFPYAKALHWYYCFWKNRDILLMEGIMGWILVLTRRFIPNNTKKWWMKHKERIRKKPLQLHVVYDPYFVDKQIIDKQLQLIRFCLYIIKGYRNTPINLILNL